MTGQASPDGNWQWDGTKWKLTEAGAVRGAGPGDEPALPPSSSGGASGRAWGVKWWGLGLISLGALALGVGALAVRNGEPSASSGAANEIAPPRLSGSPAPSTSVTPAASPSETAAPSASETAAVVSIPSSGIFEVGGEVEPGLYRAEGSGYWERLSDPSRDFDAIIANRNFVGSTYVRIRASDEYFSTSGTGDWLLIDEDAKGERATSFAGDGMFMVGVDIRPGTYSAAGSGYWQRLNAATGERRAVIADGRPDGIATVRIRASDRYFNSNGMEQWTREE